MAGYVFSMTQLFLSMHIFARSWNGNLFLICERAVHLAYFLILIQCEEKLVPPLLILLMQDCLNTQSDCNPYVALLNHFS